MSAPTLEELIKRGEVTSALLLKGDFTASERRLIDQAYAIGVEHGRASAVAASPAEEHQQ